MTSATRDLTTLRFDGPRFADHGLEIDVLPELVAYKHLLIETAKELWRRNHPDRVNLPKGFESSITIKFYELRSGSTSVPLRREVTFQDGQLPLQTEDEVDEAADVLEASMDAAGKQAPLPPNLPKSVVPLFAEFGKTLVEGETIFAQSRRRATPVPYTSKIREQMLACVERLYEDVVDITGEVRLADLDGRNFLIRQDGGRKVGGKFEPEQEALITEALRDHAVRQLRIQGMAEFSQDDGTIRRITRVDAIQPFAPGERAFNASAAPIWQTLADIGAQVPGEEWEKVPVDMGRNLDHYLYGKPKTVS